MAKARFLAVCLNPVIQNTLVYDRLDKGEVNRTSEYRLDASGKGVNAARVLAQLGYSATYLAQLGGPTREWFLAMCEADGLRVRWAESLSPIRVCTTVIDRAAGSATELVEEALPVGPGTDARVMAAFEEALAGADAVLFSGTKAPGFPEGMIPSMVGRAATAGKAVFLDLKGSDLQSSLEFRPRAAKPNLEELLQTYAPEKALSLRSGAAMDDGALRDFVASVGRDYAERYGASLVVTRGPLPTLYWEAGGLRELAAPRIESLNPIGSGDSFTAGLAASLMSGSSLAEAVAEGNRLGALNAQCLKPGSIA